MKVTNNKRWVAYQGAMSQNASIAECTTSGESEEM